MPQLGEEVFVTPRPGLAVTDAHGRPLQAGLVRWSENWQRRLEAGDVDVLLPVQVEELPVQVEELPVPAPPMDLREAAAPPEASEAEPKEAAAPAALPSEVIR